MKIASVEGIPLEYELGDGREFGSARGGFDRRVGLLVRVETADGLVGWGEASYGPPQTVATLIDEALAPMVIGNDPHNVRTLCERLYTETYHFGRQGLLMTGLSGIDIALWDILGKRYEQPVHALLGGAFRQEVTPYASTMYITNWQDPKTPIKEAKDDEFSAIKIKLGCGVEDDVERVRIARDILGEEALIAIDYNGNYTAKQAIRSIDAIKEYGIYWVEEPVPQEDLSGYRTLSRMTDIPLAAGEAAFSRFEFKRLLDEATIDIFTLDVGKCGGLAEASFLASLATTGNVIVRPHVWMGAVGIAASLQFVATISRYPHSVNVPDPFLFECDRAPNPFRDEIISESIDPTGGTLAIPDRPGLGVTPDLDAIDQYRID